MSTQAQAWLTRSLARYRIAQDSTHVVMPNIDGLTRQFEYHKGGVELVGFNTQIVDHGIGQ